MSRPLRAALCASSCARTAPAQHLRPALTQLALATAAFTTAMATAQAQTAPAVQRIEIVGTTPLRSSASAADRLPAAVQSADAEALARSHALDLSSFLGRQFGSVSLNELQGNPLQPDLNFRGYTASPLLGTPQGLSLYLDGVRLNQPFGDVVSWDLIPRIALARIDLLPGSNPLFGLNTLGGALALQTKDGASAPGSAVQLRGGSHGRAGLEFEHGARSADGWHHYAAGTRYHEQGWRAVSPSDQGQLYAKVGRRQGSREWSVSLSASDNHLVGNGLQEIGALQRDWSSVYTTPDDTRNRGLLLIAQGRDTVAPGWTLSATAHARRLRSRTTNGDVNDGSLDQSVYQPSTAERAALTAAGYSGFPASGASAANTPFPQWRCIANVLLNDEPNEKCNGLMNRSATAQDQAGLTLELAGQPLLGGTRHQWVIGAAAEGSRVHFRQSTQFGYLNADRSVTPVDGPGAFADGTQPSEDAFDARVDLRARTRTVSLYASDVISPVRDLQLTLAARWNRQQVQMRDAISPGGGTGSLDGDHTFQRLNPALGLSFAASPTLTVYGGLNQGSRAPTAVELGCADPAAPCRLPNAFASDPPLKQVVTTTAEAGLRGQAGALRWNAGAFRADNRDDLLFVAAGSSGFGYFRNFGQTRRQGLELGLQWAAAATLQLGLNASLLDATYRSAETVGGSANSSSDAAQGGAPGTEGRIAIRAGDRIPLLPRQQLKLNAQWTFAPGWRLDLDWQGQSGALARGNENGQHQPDGVYYTGPGRSAGFGVGHLALNWQATPDLSAWVQVLNVGDRRYASGAQLGANAFDANGRFIARPLPRNAAGDYPVISSTFLAPGAPRTLWLGLRWTLGG